MRSALRHPVTWLKAHPTTADVLLALVVFVLALPVFFGDPTGPDVPDYRDRDALAVLLVALGSLPLVRRRHAPMTVLVITTASAMLYEVLGYPSGAGPLGVLVALYTVAAHSDRTKSRIGFVVAGAGLSVALVAARWEATLGIIISNSVIFGTAWLIGDNIRTRRAYVESLRERAERAEQTRREEAERAVADERARIARELHDVVAHSMSVMIVQATAARRVIDRNPKQAGDALASIESTGRQAMAEMRRLLGVLRQESDADSASPAFAPQPSMQHLDDLVSQLREAGLPVTVEVSGEPRELPPGVDLSAYRIVQEALTNSLRHAGPARATLRVEFRDDELALEVVDDGRGAAATATATNGGRGHGLVGMRERVELFDGELNVGPRPGGGFSVRARLPYGKQRNP